MVVIVWLVGFITTDAISAYQKTWFKDYLLFCKRKNMVYFVSFVIIESDSRNASNVMG
jgi:hypothetical protein